MLETARAELGQIFRLRIDLISISKKPANSLRYSPSAVMAKTVRSAFTRVVRALAMRAALVV